MNEFWEGLRQNLWGAWLGAALLLGLAEMFSLELFLLMLAVGAVVGMVADLAGLHLWLQVLAAAGASVAMIGLVRPSIVKKLHHGPDLRHGPAALIGQEGFVTAQITPSGGQVKLAGEIWTARPYDEHAVIREGARVQVFEIRGATAYVHEVPELDS